MQALLLIFFSEIGDKTFFIALLLALQQPRALVFTGARSGGPCKGRLLVFVRSKCGLLLCSPAEGGAAVGCHSSNLSRLPAC